ncbi:hypothetical protein ANN_21833 [Periplaneta americana]|uniref:Uncharacterized protein n=1 Tax=Periplaneta americana TaxID=6978 RepID=A0ABQ8S6U8_PERAM|nr:hypothetical protein ANN_21833 [Periplaneta americana]
MHFKSAGLVFVSAFMAVAWASGMKIDVTLYEQKSSGEWMKIPGNTEDNFCTFIMKNDMWKEFVHGTDIPVQCPLNKHSYFEVNELTVRKSVEFISSKFDSLREELAHTRHELNSTKEEMKRLVQENDHLKQKVSDQQQYTSRDNIMLLGVPEINEQSTYEVIDPISEVIGGSELVQHDVSIAHRIPFRPGKTRPIVIRFTNRRSRDEWLQLFRNEAKNDDSSPGIAIKKVNRELPEGRITAGDQLTAETKTRDARKDEASPGLTLSIEVIVIEKGSTKDEGKIGTVDDNIIKKKRLVTEEE